MQLHLGTLLLSGQVSKPEGLKCEKGERKKDALGLVRTEFEVAARKSEGDGRSRTAIMAVGTSLSQQHGFSLDHENGDSCSRHHGSNLHFLSPRLRLCLAPWFNHLIFFYLVTDEF